MRRYRFGLESALRARRAQEDVARQRLADANHQVQRARSAHRAAVDAYRAVAVAGGVTDRDTFAARRAQEMRMAESVERAHRAVAQAEVQAATLYAAWVEAGKQVASLERLDERRRSEWAAEALRDEARAVDDVVAARWSAETAAEREAL
ncbi:MAG TPA: flagellar FliJ family protein [Acidimicrobiales bacterium]|nr:flagellar FliJ family protein [Acidimicrobiales bacterium]